MMNSWKCSFISASSGSSSSTTFTSVGDKTLTTLWTFAAGTKELSSFILVIDVGGAPTASWANPKLCKAVVNRMGSAGKLRESYYPGQVVLGISIAVREISVRSVKCAS